MYFYKVRNHVSKDKSLVSVTKKWQHAKVLAVNRKCKCSSLNTNNQNYMGEISLASVKSFGNTL